MWIRNKNGKIVELDEKKYSSQKNFYEEYYKIVYNKSLKEEDHNKKLEELIKGLKSIM